MSTDPAAELAALEHALATGVLRVRHGDTETLFRSFDEIKQIIALLKTKLSLTSRTRIRYPIQLTKGL